MAKNTNKSTSKTVEGDSLKASTDKGTASEIEQVTPKAHADAGQTPEPNPKVRIPVLDMEPVEAVGHIDIASDADRGDIQRGPVQDSTVVVPPSTPEAAEPVAADIEPTWPLAVWRDVVLVKIGQPVHVLAGAMVGQDMDAEYSEAQIRSLVENFLNTPAR